MIAVPWLEVVVNEVSLIDEAPPVIKPSRLCFSIRTAGWLVILAALQIGCSRNQTTAGKSAEPANAAPSQAQSTEARPPRNPLKNAYFGDLHLHSGYSMDAFAFGTRTTPEDSYKYAMGESVDYMGKPQKRIAPLDFLAVTDHAEYLGVVRDTIDPNGPFAKSEWYTVMTNPD